MNSLKNKVAIVTGSSRGLGKAIAERFAALGANIVVNYSKDKASAEQVVKNIEALGVKALLIQGDMSVVADIKNIFNEAIKSFGKIDIVVANAGIESVDLPVTEFTEDQFDQIYNLNTKGAYFTIQQAALRIEDKGRIIYISSSTTIAPMKGMAVYGGSKSAPKYLVEVLAKEIGHRGVTVNSIIPYATDEAGIFTENHSSRDWLINANPMKRLASVTDVANAAEFFATEMSSFVNGHHLVIDGGGYII